MTQCTTAANDFSSISDPAVTQKRNPKTMNFKRSLENFFSQVRVQKQLTSVFILALIIPVACIGFLLLYNSQKSLYDHYREQAKSDCLRVRSIMFDLTTNLYNVSEDLVYDNQLQTLLQTQWSSAEEARAAVVSYTRLQTLKQKDTSISSISIYTFNDTLAGFGDFLSVDDDLQKRTWFSKASSSPVVFWETQRRDDAFGNTYWELNLYRQIPLPQTRSHAVLVLTVSNNYMKNRISNNTLNTLVTVNKYPVFYSTRKQYTGKPLPVELSDSNYNETFSGVLAIDGTDQMAAVSTLNPYKSEDTVYIVSYNPAALSELSLIRTSYLFILAFALLIPCLLIYLFIRYFSARVNTLREAMHQASHNDYNIIDSFHGNDELSEAFKDLQSMILEIQKKEAMVYEARLTEQRLENQQQQMEYKMLASQINPHFLYNTLETIRMKAFAAGNREVAMAIKLLGKSLRYVLENTGTVSTTLAREIEYLKIYFSIQQLRFGDRVNYTIDVAPGLDLENYQLLPLLLQPIVENAVSHGLENIDENGQVTIRICEQDDTCLCITITDNGIGMTEEELALLRKNISEKDTSRTQSIGLYNINQRIQLCYGPQYSLNVSSEKGKGTQVILLLPLNKLLE